jgi:hypothetical protein
MKYLPHGSFVGLGWLPEQTAIVPFKQHGLTGLCKGEHFLCTFKVVMFEVMTA